MLPTTPKKDELGTCPIQNLVRVLSDTWTILILRNLLTSQRRFCEIEKSLSGISTRTLTLKLQKLIREGIIGHNEHYYSITKKGEKLRPIIHEIEKVGKKF